MIKVSWILHFCLLASSSLQLSLPSTKNGQREAQLDFNLKQAQLHSTISQSEILVKRTSPEREMHLNEPNPNHPINTRKRLVEEWDKLESSSYSKRTKEEKRRDILREVIKTVTYHPDHKRDYVLNVYSILGRERIKPYRKQIHRNLTSSVQDESDRKEFATLWRRRRNRHHYLRKQRADEELFSQDKNSGEIEAQGWEDDYFLDDAEEVASIFENPNSDELNSIDRRRQLLQEWDKLDHSPLVLEKHLDRLRSGILKNLFKTVPYDANKQAEFVKTIHEIFGEARIKQHGYQINKGFSSCIPKSHTEERERMQKILHNLRNRRYREKHSSSNKSIRDQDGQSSHERDAPGNDGQQNQYYGYIDDYEAQQESHEHVHQAGVHSIQEPIYWPDQAPLGPSTEHHDGHYGFDDANHVASMFQNMHDPSDSSQYHHH